MPTMTPMLQEERQAQTANHRSRVGADRREQMRMRLIASAMLVFARRGADLLLEHAVDRLRTTYLDAIPARMREEAAAA